MNNSEFLQNVVKKLKEVIKENNYSDRLCVIFDIDDTLISTMESKPIKQTYDLYNKCLQLGLTVFIVTARNALQSNIKVTQKELHKYNIINYHTIYFRPINIRDIFKYKYDCRKDIFDKGYHCIMSIGDQITDLGDYGGMGILINHR